VHHLSFNSLIFHSLFVSFLWYIFNIFVLIYLSHVFHSLLNPLYRHVVNILVLKGLGDVLNLVFNLIIINGFFFYWYIFYSNLWIVFYLANLIGDVFNSGLTLNWLIIQILDLRSTEELGLTLS